MEVLHLPYVHPHIPSSCGICGVHFASTPSSAGTAGLNRPGDQQSIGLDSIHLTGHQDSCPGSSFKGYHGRRTTAQAAQRGRALAVEPGQDATWDSEDSSAFSVSMFTARTRVKMMKDVRREFAEQAGSMILSECAVGRTSS